MGFNRFFLIDYKLFSWLYIEHKAVVWDGAIQDHPDPETDDPLLYKLLKADFVVRGQRMVWISLGVCSTVSDEAIFLFFIFIFY